MALLVEDGTGLAAADSYLSVADANAYHSAMGYADWDGASDATKEAALRRATQYIDARYRFRGEPLTSSQALAWPRAGYDWPQRRIQQATAELALRALAGALHSDQSTGEVARESVGPITVEYAASGLSGQTRYAIVDDLLVPLTGSGRSAVRLERAS